jgi:hypothetical protein
MTLEQAKQLSYHDELHYTGRHPCSITIGPRGGVRESITRVRVSGKPQTWKRDSSRIRVPVKHGLYESGYIDEHNLADWHLASDCHACLAHDAMPAGLVGVTFTHKEV